MMYRLVAADPRIPTAMMPNVLNLIFDADHYSRCKAATDYGEACRGGFVIERLDDDVPMEATA